MLWRRQNEVEKGRRETSLPSNFHNRFQWRTTVSYYMCWYTMLEVPDLATFGEPCDNHANCLDEYDVHNKDPRADDTKPYACALYSFCPDHCCPMKHIRYMKDCYQSESNPCYAENQPAHRKCTLNRDENLDFQALRANQINVSCECHRRGYEWSSRFGLCIDVNECVRGTHNCTQNAESCLNLPGYYVCVCRLGYIYNSEIGQCQKLKKREICSPRSPELLPDLPEVVMYITESIFHSF
ncbi:NID2 protein, partial [Acromyrmex insinuator]